MDMLTQSGTDQLLNPPPKPSHHSSLIKNILLTFLILCLITYSLITTIQLNQLQKLTPPITTTFSPPHPIVDLPLDLSEYDLASLTLISESNASRPITSLILDSYEIAELSNNILPELTYLKITNYNSSKYLTIASNRFEKLTWLSITVGGVISVFIGNQLPKLTNLGLNKSNFEYFTKNKMESLEFLEINSIERSFSGNWMPNLKRFQLLGYQNSTLKFGEQCPNVTTIILRNGSLTTFSESLPSLKNLQIYNHKVAYFDLFAPQLEQLEISFNNLTSFVNKSLPSLKTLNLNGNQISLFSNNYLPNLEQITLNNNVKIDLFQLLYFQKLFIISINNLQLSTDFNDIRAPNWVSLFAISSNITSFSGNNMTKLVKLYLMNNPLSEFPATNNLPLLAELSLHACYLSTLEIQHLKNLQFLYLSSNNLTQFVNQSLPKLTHLQLQANRLMEFSGNQLPNLVSLTLDMNYLTDQIGDELVRMNLTQIGYISIRNNQIVDQVAVQNLLKQKYPAAAILVQDSLK